MTDKEKEAIKTMQHWIEYEKANKEKINKADELIEIQETVLNLIQTQQEEIEDLKWKNKIYVKSIKSHKSEIEKKDKVIDEMAIYLADIDFDECCAEIPEPCLSCSWEDYEPHTNCIKEYFINKVEKEN